MERVAINSGDGDSAVVRTQQVAGIHYHQSMCAPTAKELRVEFDSGELADARRQCTRFAFRVPKEGHGASSESVDVFHSAGSGDLR